MEGNSNREDNDIVYSSQNILSDSLAGRKRGLFTRVKKTKHLKESPVQTDPSHPAPKVTKKHLKIAGIVSAGTVVLAGAILAIVVIINNVKAPEESSPDGGGEATYTPEELSYIEEIPENIAAMKPDPMGDEKLGVSITEYAIDQIKYINALIDNNLLKAAANEMESVMSEVEMDPDAFSDCELASIRRASLRIQETDIAAMKAAGKEVAEASPEEENTGFDEGGNKSYTDQIIDRMNRAMETCNE